MIKKIFHLAKEKPRTPDQWIVLALAFFCGLIFFVPLIVSWDFFYPFVYPKTLAYFFLIEIMVALFIPLFVCFPAYRPQFKTREGKIDWLLVAPFLFVFITLGSNIFSQNPAMSFWGYVNRAGGLLGLIHFAALFLITASVFRRRIFWLWLLRVNVAFGTYVTAVSIFQSVQGNYPIATFGNPAYIAGYLIFVLFHCLFLFYWEEKRAVRMIAMAAFLINLLNILVFLDVRSAIIACAAGFFSAGFFFFFSYREKRIRMIALASFLVATLVIAILSAYFIRSGKVYSLFERTRTIKTRLIGWDIALQGIRERPLTGFGEENFYIPFEKHFDPLYYSRQNDDGKARERGMDEPHNKFFSIAVSGGLAALAAYGLMFAVYFRSLLKAYKNNKLNVYIASASLLVAYLVNNIFFFDTATTMVLLFFTLALNYFFVRRGNLSEKKEGEHCAFNRKSYLTIGAAILFFSAAAWFFVLEPARASKNANLSARLLSESKFPESAQAAQDVFSKGKLPQQLALTLELSEGAEIMFSPKKSFTPQEQEYLRFLIEKNQFIINSDPGRKYSYVTLGKLMNIAGRFEGSFWEKNARLMEMLMENGSRRIEIPFIWAEAQKMLGRDFEAKQSCQKGIELNPEYGFSYFTAAYLCFNENEKTGRLEYLKKAIENKFENAQSLNLYVSLARELGKEEEAKWAENELKRLPVR